MRSGAMPTAKSESKLGTSVEICAANAHTHIRSGQEQRISKNAHTCSSISIYELLDLSLWPSCSRSRSSRSRCRYFYFNMYLIIIIIMLRIYIFAKLKIYFPCVRRRCTHARSSIRSFCTPLLWCVCVCCASIVQKLKSLLLLSQRLKMCVCQPIASVAQSQALARNKNKKCCAYDDLISLYHMYTHYIRAFSFFLISISTWNFPFRFLPLSFSPSPHLFGYEFWLPKIY